MLGFPSPTRAHGLTTSSIIRGPWGYLQLCGWLAGAPALCDGAGLALEHETRTGWQGNQSSPSASDSSGFHVRGLGLGMPDKGLLFSALRFHCRAFGERRLRSWGGTARSLTCQALQFRGAQGAPAPQVGWLTPSLVQRPELHGNPRMSGWKEAYTLVPTSIEISMGETEAQREVVTLPGSLSEGGPGGRSRRHSGFWAGLGVGPDDSTGADSFPPLISFACSRISYKQKHTVHTPSRKTSFSQPHDFGSPVDPNFVHFYLCMFP